MRLLIALLLLQLVVTTHGFRRLGTIDVDNVTGRVYLIDANSIFLYEFTTTNDLVFSTSTGAAYTLTGPKDNITSMYDLSADILDSPYLEVRENNTLIASFYIPNNVYVPCNAEYLGEFIIPVENTTYHALQGHVFMDRPHRRFFVAGFNLDGAAPFAFFWFDAGDIATASGIKGAASHYQYEPLPYSPSIDVNVTFPPGYTNTQFKTLSVWCVDFYVSFGQVSIPVVASDPFTCDDLGPVWIGLTSPRHDVVGDMYVLGPTTIGLNSLFYDGNPPATWYWTGMNSSLPDGYIVRDQFSSLAPLKTEIINDNIVLSLPQGTDVCNADFFSVYCVRASVSFSTVNITESFNCSNCPANCKTNIPNHPSEFQCMDIDSNIRVEYLYEETNGYVTLRLHTCDLEAEEYVAVGLSGSNTSVSMLNGDAIVCYTTTTGEGVCSDYSLTTRSQCADINSDGNYQGACPNSVLGETDLISNTQVEYLNGITTFTTTKSTVGRITSSDTYYLIWSRGGTFDAPTGEGRWPLKHGPGDRATVDSPIQIRFSNDSTCEGYFQCATTPPVVVTAWTIPPICIDDASDPIKAYIGNTGSKQGYRAITGKDGWGISWYLNGLLVPEVYILRGSTVTFEVYGGDDSTNPAKYHPLYITSSDEGGIAGGAQSGEIIFAGLNNTGASPTGYTTGEYCEWSESSGNGDQFSSWEAYKAALTTSCTDCSIGGTFEWTTDANTPDTVYYQCATHRLLGWRIHVVDDLGLVDVCASAYVILPFSLLLFVAVLLTLFLGF